MLTQASGTLIVLGALVIFGALALHGARRLGIGDRDQYLTARSTQGAWSLGLSFFASALGGWILFSPPEVGTFSGLLGVAGYALGQGAAIGIFAFLGLAIRQRVPEGSTILEFVRRRFGRPFQAYVGGVSVLYMFVFLIAELTAIGGVVALLTGAGRLLPIVAVAGVTAAYTAYGGLPASIYTDRWQAWIVMVLVVVGAISVAGEVRSPIDAIVGGGLTQVTRVGAETAVVLVIAVIAANLFHQGFWQRVWSAKDLTTLRRGALAGGALILPLIFLMGVAGMAAVGAGRTQDPSVAFFGLIAGMPQAVLAVVLALAVALIASTADTLQNALTSLGAIHLTGERLGLGPARMFTILLTIPAAVIALQGASVLRIFLIADLLAATIALPVLLGLWRRATTAGALAGAGAGLLGVVVLGWITRGGLVGGLALLTLPDGPSLGAFVVAPLASLAATLLVSLAWPTTKASHPA